MNSVSMVSMEGSNKVYIISKRLKKLRERNNYSQKRVAESLSISNVQLSRYESGIRQPDYDTLLKLADFYEVTVDYLLGKTDKENEEQFDPIAEHNRLLKKYGIEDSGFFDIEKWKQMGPEELKQLEDYFEFIVSKAKERNKDSE